MSKIIVDTSAQQDGDAIQTVSTKDSDPANTVVTKDYLSSKIQAIPKLDAYTKTEVNNLLDNKLDKNATAKNSDMLGNKPAVDYALRKDMIGGMPIGSYLMWPSLSYTPDGFVPCDGQLLKKAEYPELYEILGETYGGGGDSFAAPTFNDGRFVRGIGGNAASIGVAQGDAIRNITGKVDFWGNRSNLTALEGALYSENNGGWKGRPALNEVTADEAPNILHLDASRQVPTANENRPYNSCVKWLIKCKNSKLYSSLDKSLIATESQPGVFKVKQQINGSATDATVTEKAIVDKLFGYDYSCHDRTNEMQDGTTYTNTHSLPIILVLGTIAATQSGLIDTQLWYNGANIISTYHGPHTGVTPRSSITMFLLPGDTYKTIGWKKPGAVWLEYYRD